MHANCNIRAPKVADVKAFINLHAHTEKKDTEANELAARVNFKYENFHLGVAAAHDLKEWTDVRNQLVWNKTKNVQVYTKVDWIKHLAIFGNTMNIKCHNVHVSNEFIYDWSEKAAAYLFGYPLTFQLGGVYKAAKGTKVKFSTKVRNTVESHLAVTHKLDKQMTVGVHQHFDTGKIKSTPYHIGFELSYKL